MGTLTFSHPLTPGHPENVSHVQDNLNDIKTLLNGNIEVANCQTGTGSTQLAAGNHTHANAMGVVEHGATAATARPTGFHRIMWIGSVEPTNASDGDLWTDTS